MLKKLLLKLEDPENPLLGPNLWGLRLLGFLLPDNHRWKKVMLIMNSIVFLFIVTEIVDIWMIRSDLDTVVLNLQTSMCSTVSALKVVFLYIFQARFEKVLTYVTKADIAQRKSTDPDNVKLINVFTKYCRRITYVYWCILIITGLNKIALPIIKYIIVPDYRHGVNNGSVAGMEIIRSWVPWDKRTLKGYLGATLYQSYTIFIGLGWISSIDSAVIVLLVFFRVEVEVLRNDCRNIFRAEENVADNESLNRIRDCHRRYINVIKYSRLFNSCMSPVMFFYMFVCTVMLCVTAYLFTEQSSFFDLMMLAEYLLFGVLQLLVYCWHSNEVIFASKDLMLGPYESRWWCASVSRQKDICILIHQFQTPIVFTAGPFTDLSIATFVTIIKGAYSYYTILKQSNN